MWLWLWILGLIGLCSGRDPATENFHVSVNSRGEYRVEVGGQSWLRAAPTFFTAHGRHYTTADGSLVLTHTDTDAGYDVLGPWNSTRFNYKLSGTRYGVQTEIKEYLLSPLVLFGQTFPMGLDGSRVGPESKVSSGFPSFYMEDAKQSGRKSELGYLAYGGIMTGDMKKTVGIWNNASKMISGLDSGPLVLFDRSDHALIVSPFTNFMAASVDYRSRNASNMTASWGLLGNADHVPEGFSYWTAVLPSTQGVNKLIDHWGDILRLYYQKDTSYRDSDFSNNYLGYYTDNGAYYYYLTEGQQNYEQTILDVKKYSDKLGIPYRYVQYDSWFYPKDRVRGGVTEWDSMMSIFPNGLQYLWEKTGWPVVAHNRWWSNTTVYAKQNGGKYNFIIESKTRKALPVDQSFWDDLMMNSKKWGLITYEQDWLNVQFDEMDATIESLTLGREWLHQMARGAHKSGLTIQYCMAPSRHILTSLELPAVTQTRVSTDYQPGKNNWKIGLSSMFAHAVGLACFKDNFWTTEYQPGNVYNGSEPHPERHALVATLSKGPVAPSDKIGHSNVSLIMRSCNKDGLLLQPSRPAMAINKQLLLTAFSGFRGEVWSTYSRISGLEFGVILGADFSPQDRVTVTPGEAGLANLRNGQTQYRLNDPSSLGPFGPQNPVVLTSCTDFCLVYTSPVLSLNKQEVVILGELDKWVPVSADRVTSVAIATDDIHLTLTGAVRETVTMVMSIDRKLVTVACLLSEAGTAVLSVATRGCHFL